MSLPGRGYGFTVILTSVGVLVVGGLALKEFFQGDSPPIFPVQIVGSVDEVALAVYDAPGVRPTERSALREGRFGPLLPVHAESGLGWAPPQPPPRVYGLGAAGAGLDYRSQTLLASARDSTAGGGWRAALPLYDRLHARYPANRSLALERARALSWWGEHARAAVALAELWEDAGDAEEKGDLMVEAARNHWWAGNAEMADSLLGLRLGIGPRDAGVADLRAEVRRTAAPSVATASRWLEEGGGPLEQWLLAEAYVRAGDYGRALAPLRALATGPDAADSLYLTLAGTASAADSTAVVIDALSRYLLRRPDDRTSLLTLARTHKWVQQYDQSLAFYDRLIGPDASASLRFERAEVLVWSNRPERAEPELLAVVDLDPFTAAALHMLGDLARWRGDWDEARARYAAAALVEPRREGLAPALAAVDSALAERHGIERLARADEVRVAALTHTDNEGFQRAALITSHRRRTAWGSIRTDLIQDVIGSRLPIAQGFANYGYGGAVTVELTAFPGVQADLSIGMRDYEATGLMPTWGARVTLDRLLGMSTGLSYERGPATPRLATLISLYAETTSDLVRLELARPGGAVLRAAQVEYERLTSLLGGTDRIAGSLALSRVIGPGLEARAETSAQTTSRASPAVAGWGRLFWAPTLYAESSLGLAYRTVMGGGWSAGAEAEGGYAWLRERPLAAERYDAGRFPTFGVGARVTLDRPRWQVSAAGALDGALTGGYRAGTLELGGSYKLLLP